MGDAPPPSVPDPVRPRGWRRFRSWPLWVQALTWALVASLAIGIGQAGPETRRGPTTVATATPTADPTTHPRSTPEPTPARGSTPTAEPARTPTTASLPAGVPRGAQRVTVVNVTDGDTINVEPEVDGPLATNATHTVRLLLVDTPETVHPDEPVACYGPEASEFSTDQLLGATVWLESDEEDTDRYGRFLRHVWLQDGTNFNLALVEEGYADAVLYQPNDRYWGAFSATVDDARAQHTGLWGACAAFGAPLAAGGRPAPEAVIPEGEALPAGGCDPNYPDVCIQPPPPDLDCSGISARRFAVLAPDPHDFDGNDDGVGCEG